ncbi:MAG TPA: hypothetical protein VK060_04530, partial [Ruania sp.]|nr:hypothetical protein [Ruania sp.]
PRVGALVSEQEPEAYAEAISAVERRTRHLNASDVAATIGDRFAADQVAAQYADVYARVARRG